MIYYKRTKQDKQTTRQDKTRQDKRKEETKMTIIAFLVMILICGAYESITEHYGFNLESYIREIQFKSKLFS
jgi:hypothetical protein